MCLPLLIFGIGLIIWELRADRDKQPDKVGKAKTDQTSTKATTKATAKRSGSRRR
jgi:hypothetical protein